MYSGDKIFDEEIKVEIVKSFESFTEIMSASLTHPEKDQPHLAIGMTTIQTFAKSKLMRYQLDSGLGNRALMQALPYALKQVRNCIMRAADQDHTPSKSPLMIQNGNAFPHESVIADVMATYLTLDKCVELQRFDSGILVADLPLVSLWSKENATGFRDTAIEFVSLLSLFVADILALSLFSGCLDSLLIYYHLIRDNSKQTELRNIIESILCGASVGRCKVEIILDWTLNLLGHNVSADLRDGRWIGSSFRGQTVFPRIFEDKTLRTDGYLALFGLKGILMIPGNKDNNTPISMVKSRGSTYEPVVNVDISSIPISRSTQLFSDEKIQWNVQLSTDCLLASVSWTKKLLRVNPFHVLQILSGSMFHDSCPHEINSRNSNLATKFQYVIPGAPGTAGCVATTDDNNDTIAILPVKSNKGICMMLMSILWYTNDPETFKILVSHRTCLNCLADECWRTGCRYVVL